VGTRRLTMPAGSRLMPTIAGRQISDIGLGTMALSLPGRPSTERAESVILSAVEHGINWIDTADSHGLGDGIEGHGEHLVADVLERHHLRDKVLVATKGGHVWPAGQPRWVADGRPAHLRAACERSLRRLRTNSIDLYQLHSIDPAVPAREQFDALAELADSGLIAAAGISNVTVEEFGLAASILGPRLAAMQNEGSVFEEPDPSIKSRCCELSTTFIAHSALGGATPSLTLDETPEITAIARRHGTAPVMVAVSALLALVPGGTALRQHISHHGDHLGAGPANSAVFWQARYEVSAVQPPRSHL